MKKWLAIGGVCIVLGAGAFVMRSKFAAAEKEDNTIPEVPTGAPEVVKPAGKPGSRADLSKLYVWVQNYGWGNGTADGVNLYGNFYIFNEGKVPLFNMVAELTLSFPQDPSHTKKFIIPLKDIKSAMWMSSQGVLMPNQMASPISFNYRLGPEYWQRYKGVTVRIIEGEKFDDRSDLHQPMQLYAFIREAPVDKIKAAFAADPKLKEVNNGGVGPLQFALMQPDIEKVKLMESLGFDISKPVRYGESAYFFAVFGGAKMVDYVGSKKIKAAPQSEAHLSAAHYAINQWDDQVFASLARAGQPLDEKTDEGETALINAIQLRDMDLVKGLLKAGARKDVYTKRGYGPVSTAIFGGRTEFFEDLVKEFGVKEVNPDGNTLLHVAVLAVNSDMVNWFIAKGLSVNAKNKKGQRPVDLTAQISHEGDREMMRSLFSGR